ncbi:hypothetical protein EVAR_28715_1 [Eumeta japonica]|uniref:Uncharacterized protein n=1 Tax=Eumeta variegata TaxID=151549 RepID=A0A4C1V4X7_EUMVA|nr:hypothetical protein EVAR_28715_1 [Eumeta japonica]
MTRRAAPPKKTRAHRTRSGRGRAVCSGLLQPWLNTAELRGDMWCRLISIDSLGPKSSTLTQCVFTLAQYFENEHWIFLITEIGIGNAI